jgi:hypothetical protein
MLDKNLVNELRQMFIDGATPSRLMHHIANQHPDDPRLHFIISDYFREAFSIPLLRNVVSREDYSPNSRHAHYNRDVVPEIVQRMGDWNTADLKGSWLVGVSVRSLAEHRERLKAAHFEELDRVWDTLTERERLFIIRKVASANHDWDVMKSLSALAERLQQKIVELEAQLKQAFPEATAPNGVPAPARSKSPRSRAV